MTFSLYIFFPSVTGSPVGSSNPASSGTSALIVSVIVVSGLIILALLVGIVAVCLLILRGMCPKLKKQLMENVRLLKIKQNGRDDITIITEGTTAQNAKQYYQPDFELTPEKNSTPFSV